MEIFWREGYFFEKTSKLCMRGLIIVAKSWREGKHYYLLLLTLYLKLEKFT